MVEPKARMMEPVLMRAVIIFAIVVAIAVTGVGLSYLYMDDISMQKTQASRETRDWQNRIDRSVESNNIIETFEQNFRQLVKQGVVGEEQRLVWFETLQSTARERGMPSVKYSISTQVRVIDKALEQTYPGIDVYKSTMTISAKIGHEGDLFALLNDLEGVDGLYTVDYCDIDRYTGKTVDNFINMKATCELGWYTFRKSEAQ